MDSKKLSEWFKSHGLEEKVLEKSAAPSADTSTSERRQLAVLFCLRC